MRALVLLGSVRLVGKVWNEKRFDLSVEALLVGTCATWLAAGRRRCSWSTLWRKASTENR